MLVIYRIDRSILFSSPQQWCIKLHIKSSKKARTTKAYYFYSPKLKIFIYWSSRSYNHKIKISVLIEHEIEGCAQQAFSWDENSDSYQGLAGRPFALLFIGGVWANGIQHKLSIAN